MLTLDIKLISKDLKYKYALEASKSSQTGIINIIKENQRELTKYLNIQYHNSISKK